MREDRVRDHPDPRLDRRAVADEPRDVLPDPHRDVVRRGRGPREERNVALDDVVDVLEVDETVAERARHLPVDLGDDDLRRISAAALTTSTETPSEQKP